MIRFTFDQDPDAPLSILCLGAHSDDIEIGCGATILTLAERHRRAIFDWVVFSANGIRKDEANCAAQWFAGAALRRATVYDFPDGFLPYYGADVKSAFEQIKRDLAPDLILCPHLNDAHQDHRVVSELAWNTFRNHTILEYEIPKYDGDLGRPNVYVPLTDTASQKKVDGLLQVFQSQRARHWFTSDVFLGLMRIRGMECNSSSGYAEAFHSRKLVL
jgi:LmbE family N-acetylglucosaminyl deacetylase